MNANNPNPFKFIDIIALREDSYVVVLGGSCLGGVCNVVGEKLVTSLSNYFF